MTNTSRTLRQQHITSIWCVFTDQDHSKSSTFTKKIESQYYDFLLIVTWALTRPLHKNVKSEVLPYSLPIVGPGADPGVQTLSPQVTISHPPAVGCHYFPPGLRFTFVSIHQMAPPLTKTADIQLQPTTHLSTPKGWNAELAWIFDL